MTYVKTFEEHLNEGWKPDEKDASKKFDEETVGYYAMTSNNKGDVKILAYDDSIELIKQHVLKLSDSSKDDVYLATIAWSKKKSTIEKAKETGEPVTNKGVKVLSKIKY